MNGYELQKGSQNGTLSLGDKTVSFNIISSGDIFYIRFYEDGVFVFGGKKIENGANYLYGLEHLGYGTRLEYRGTDDMETANLIYEE